MKKSLAMAARTLERGRTRAFISRVAWLDLDRLVSSAYQEISANGQETTELGNLCLTRNIDRPPFNRSHFSAANIINQIQVSAGWRPLDLSHAVTDNGDARSEFLAESGATLWYAQDATGSVTVFLAPYKSKAMSMNEENIILASYGCANSVSARAVRQHFAAYFRYCSVTSAHGNLGVTGYIFRLRLKYKDFRYASQIRASVFRYFESALAVVGIIATLYAGNKLFS